MMILEVTLLVVVLLSVGVAIYYCYSLLSDLSHDTKLLWDFLYRRGIAESIEKGVLVEREDHILVVAYNMFPTTLMTEMVEFVRNRKEKSDKELFILLEERFGETLVTEVCIPNNLHRGACLIGAIHLCRKELSQVGVAP